MMYGMSSSGVRAPEAFFDGGHYDSVAGVSRPSRGREVPEVVLWPSCSVEHGGYLAGTTHPHCSIVFCLCLRVSLYGRPVRQYGDSRVLPRCPIYARLGHACPVAMVMFAGGL